jgi:hypothetical protein
MVYLLLAHVPQHDTGLAALDADETEPVQHVALVESDRTNLSRYLI